MRSGWIGAAVAACLCGAASAQTVPLEWNVRPQVVPLFARLESGQVASLAIVGDSISFRANSYNWFLRDRFWADYGNAGDGYLATGSGFSGSGAKNGARDPIRYTKSGNVFVANESGVRTVAGYSTPDGIYSLIADTGLLDLTFYGPETRLHYLIQPGGGAMRLTLNGAPIMDVPTDGAMQHGVVGFNTGRAWNITSVLRLTSVDGRPVQAIGLDARTGLPGMVYHRLARGGAGPRDFGRSNTPETAAILSELAPDLLIVMLDWVGIDEKETFIEDTRTLLDFYAQAMPASPVVLMTHHPFKEDIGQEAVWLYQVAQERDLGFINLYAAIPGGFDQMDQAGFLDDLVHLSAVGGQWFGDYVYTLLKHDGTCAPPTVDSQPDNQDVMEGTPASFSVTSSLGTAYQWRKDGVERPGATEPTLTIDAAAPGDAGVYDCRVSNDCDAVLSGAAVLTVTPDGGEAWWYGDADGDGYGVEGNALFQQAQPEGYVAQAGDCDDADPLRFPGAQELLNGVDDDCDGAVDDGFETWWYRDADGDGYGLQLDSLFEVVQPEGFIAASGDCDDDDPLRFPGAQELLNGVDDDCDGAVDNGFESWWYRDADGDGHGLGSDALFEVVQPEGYVAASGDCNDGDAGINPDAEEVFDGADNDCDGEVDEGVAFSYYRDADDDGFGDPGSMVIAGAPPEGYVADSRDCDDGNAAVNPDATEVCDGADNNCDGQTDEDTWPVILQDPAGLTVYVGDAAEFGVLDTGGSAYQWRRNGANIIGATSPVYKIASVLPFHAGIYTVVVSNPCGQATSAGAVLTVLNPVAPTPPSGLKGIEPAKGTASMTWADNANNETKFQVWREKRVNNKWQQGAIVVTLPADSVSYFEQPGIGEWRYRVRAGQGNAYSAWSAYGPVAPAQPAALKVQKVNGQAALSWTDTSDFEATFTVQRQMHTGAWGASVTLPTQGVDSGGLTDAPGPGKYRYRVRSGNAGGSSVWTGWVVITL